MTQQVPPLTNRGSAKASRCLSRSNTLRHKSSSKPVQYFLRVFHYNFKDQIKGDFQRGKQTYYRPAQDESIDNHIRDDVKLAELVRAQDCQSRGRRFASGKNSKNPRTQIYMDFRYIDPQARVLNYYFK